MKLIFIYGPPAVGKLTIAKKLSELTGVSLFHNHITRDLVKDIFEENLETHYDLVTKIRQDVLSYCAKHDKDLIFTYVYGGAQDDENVASFIASVEDNGGELLFVELTADREDLLQRVGNDDRKRFKKLFNPEILENLTEDMGIFSIPFVDKVVINTSEVSADDAVAKIAELL